jgi:hypothetical protein
MQVSPATTLPQWKMACGNPVKNKNRIKLSAMAGLRAVGAAIA